MGLARLNATECNDVFPSRLCIAVEERIFPGHAQWDSERLFDLRSEYFQVQARPANGIHDSVVNVKPSSHFRRRGGGDAEVNGVKRTDAAGSFQHFTGWFATESAIQSSRVGF